MKPINLFTVKILGKPLFEPLAVAAQYSGQPMIDLMAQANALPEEGPWNVLSNGLGRPHKKDPRHKELPPYLQLDRRSTAEMIRNARNTLWAKVDWEERRADAQFARSFQMPLPSFLGLAAQKELAEAFCQTALVDAGMIADWSLAQHARRHEQDNKQDAMWGRAATDGAHALRILATTRGYARGKFGNKDRSWNDRSLFFQWRKLWCELLAQAIDAAPEGACAPSARQAWKNQCEAYLARDPAAMEAKDESEGDAAEAQAAAEPQPEASAPSRARRL